MLLNTLLDIYKLININLGFKLLPGSIHFLILSHLTAHAYTSFISLQPNDSSMSLNRTSSRISNIETFHLFPNPANESISITCSNIKSKNVNVSIKDINGKTLLTTKFREDGIRLNIAKLISGIYFIDFRDESNVIISSQKFVKL